jgi:hypothetical protein
MSAPVSQKRRGHPGRGAIFGFLFGLFLGIDLLLFGLVPSNSAVLVVLPLVGLVGAVALGLTAPFRRRAPSREPDSTTTR